MMIGSLGIAAAQNKLSVGYGAEAGHMDPLIANMCGRYCQNSLVITRNEESRTCCANWAFPPNSAPTRHGRSSPHRPNMAAKFCAMRLGRQTPVLVVCPINPFEWPVKASIGKICGAHS